MSTALSSWAFDLTPLLLQGLRTLCARRLHARHQRRRFNPDIVTVYQFFIMTFSN
ncbi:hypothetical protein PQQ53_11590 [Paraburkholderia strydomiana]|jgi:hypothetical protein|uniref:Transposase n=1 Tax=Paraburkholderia strydomiana TaxID=1245417 RepID=A0ABW9EPM1_9BURK